MLGVADIRALTTASSQPCNDRLQRYHLERPDAVLSEELAELARFLIEQHETGDESNSQALFQAVEQLLTDGDEETKDAIKVFFLETLQNQASWKPYGAQVFLPRLGPRTRVAWDELVVLWSRNKNLANIIREETGNPTEDADTVKPTDPRTVTNPELRKILESLRRADPSE